MNERIRQLALQAQIGLFEDKSFGWSVIAGTDQHLSKFAELIIKDKDQHIKWLEDRLAHQTEQTEKAMEMAHKLMGKLKDPKEWKVLTPEQIDDIIANAIDPMDALIQTMDQLRENNT
jgi:uncharacterized protein YktB (UPF0637 family)